VGHKRKVPFHEWRVRAIAGFQEPFLPSGLGLGRPDLPGRKQLVRFVPNVTDHISGPC
jgi:hypothetical protein